MRLIEQFFQALSRILNKKIKKNYDGALEEINLTYKKLFGFDSKLINSLPDSEIIKMLEIGGGFEKEKALIIAELIKEEGEIRFLKNKEHGIPASVYIKSLAIYLYGLKDGDKKLVEKSKEKVDFLLLKLKQYGLQDRLKKNLFKYYESTGRYADAENILFELIESNEIGMLKEGISFYRRLMELSDADLENGNLPRSEVEQSLQVVEEKLKSK